MKDYNWDSIDTWNIERVSWTVPWNLWSKQKSPSNKNLKYISKPTSHPPVSKKAIQSKIEFTKPLYILQEQSMVGDRAGAQGGGGGGGGGPSLPFRIRPLGRNKNPGKRYVLKLWKMGERGETKVEIVDEQIAIWRSLMKYLMSFWCVCLKLWSPCLFLKIILSSLMQHLVAIDSCVSFKSDLSIPTHVQ